MAKAGLKVTLGLAAGLFAAVAGLNDEASAQAAASAGATATNGNVTNNNNINNNIPVSVGVDNNVGGGQGGAGGAGGTGIGGTGGSATIESGAVVANPTATATIHPGAAEGGNTGPVTLTGGGQTVTVKNARVAASASAPSYAIQECQTASSAGFQLFWFGASGGHASPDMDCKKLVEAHTDFRTGLTTAAFIFVHKDEAKILAYFIAAIDALNKEVLYPATGGENLIQRVISNSEDLEKRGHQERGRLSPLDLARPRAGYTAPAPKPQ